MKGFVAAPHRSRGPLWRRLAVPAVLALAACAALADEAPTLDDGARFDVRSAYLEPAEHVYQLNATLDLALSRNAAQAIHEGVPVVLELDLTVVRKRRYLPDVEVASLAQRWQIHYHALSERSVPCWVTRMRKFGGWRQLRWAGWRWRSAWSR